MGKKSTISSIEHHAHTSYTIYCIFESSVVFWVYCNFRMNILNLYRCRRLYKLTDTRYTLHKQARFEQFLKTYGLWGFVLFSFILFALSCVVDCRCMSVFYSDETVCLVLSRRMFGIVVRLALSRAVVYFFELCVFSLNFCIFLKKKKLFEIEDLFFFRRFTISRPKIFRMWCHFEHKS